MKYFLILITISGLIACQGAQKPSPEMNNYDISEMSQAGWSWATLHDVDNYLVEEGGFYNGRKNGVWVKYTDKGQRIEQVMNYINGKAHGLSMKLDNRNSIAEQAQYKEHQLHGRYKSYQFGKIKVDATYKDGELHGMMTKYINNKNKKLTEAEYKNGKLDGIYRHFDDKGNVTLEYTYKNGDKVSGGIVE